MNPQFIRGVSGVRYNTIGSLQDGFNFCAIQRLVPCWRLRIDSHLHHYGHPVPPPLPISEIVLKVTSVLGEFPPGGEAGLLLSLGESQALEVSLAVVVHLVRVCPSQGICLQLRGLFLLLSLILSDALAMMLPSQVSDQILWLVCTLLDKI